MDCKVGRCGFFPCLPKFAVCKEVPQRAIERERELARERYEMGE